MGMPDVRLSEDRNISPNARLTLFFEHILDAQDQLRSNGQLIRLQRIYNF